MNELWHMLLPEGIHLSFTQGGLFDIPYLKDDVCLQFQLDLGRHRCHQQLIDILLRQRN